MTSLPLVTIVCLVVSVKMALTTTTDNSKIFGQVSITAERNRTGYWNQKILLEHSTVRFGSLSLNVDYDYSHCGRVKKLKMTFNIYVRSYSKGSLPSRGYLLEGRFGLYKFHAAPKTWAEAAATCSDEGAHLAVPNSRQEALAILQFVGKEAEEGFYVGIRDEAGDGHYNNMFGVPLKESGYSLWSLSEPDPRTSGCVVLQHWEYLDSLPCNSSRPFLCEKEMLGAASNYPIGVVSV